MFGFNNKKDNCNKINRGHSLFMKEEYSKINLMYKMFNSEKDINIIEHHYVKHAVEPSVPREKNDFLDRMLKEYDFNIQKRKKIFGYKAFRVEFCGLMFDIISLRGQGFELYKPTSFSLKDSIEKGIHKGEIISSIKGVHNYLSIIFEAINEKFEKDFFGDTKWRDKYSFTFYKGRLNKVLLYDKVIIEVV